MQLGDYDPAKVIAVRFELEENGMKIMPDKGISIGVLRIVVDLILES